MRYAAAMLCLTLAACGDGTPTQPDLSGAYTLATVNGGALPAFDRQDRTYRYEITGGTLSLTQRTYWLEIVWSVTCPGGVYEQRTGGRGVYAVMGGAVQFDRGAFTGTVGDGAITVAQDGRALLFGRS